MAVMELRGPHQGPITLPAAVPTGPLPRREKREAAAVAPTLTPQAVPGAESVEILEVIDHHKLGNPGSSLPITFLTAPVGSTCTIVASLYRERGLVPDHGIAALLLAGTVIALWPDSRKMQEAPDELVVA